jgi:hypothetical protein
MQNTWPGRLTVKRMRPKIFTLIFSVLVLAGVRVVAQNYDTNNVVVETFAGSGFYGYYDGQGVLTMFNAPSAIVSDSSSNLFVLDSQNSLIRKVTPDVTVSTYYNYFGYSAVPQMAIDRSNALYLCSIGTSLVRISSNGVLTQINVPIPGFGSPVGLCFDSASQLYVSDGNGNRICRRDTNGVWEVFAGSGNYGAIDGNWIFTSFYAPRALAADAANNIYVWDSGNHLIRRINPQRDVQTIAGNNSGFSVPDVDGVGTNASFSNVQDMRVDPFGNLILACATSIRKMSPTTNVSTIAGSFGESGYVNGPGATARFRNAAGICWSEGMIFVADANDHRIRQITFNASAQPVTGPNLSLIMLPALEINGLVGRSYRIESSTNLENWMTEDTVFLTSSPYLWTDPAGATQKKFYRAFLLP